jgi:gluconokinase
LKAGSKTGGKAGGYLIMGVSGSGKTTVGRALVERLTSAGCPGWEFLDADDFHPPANIARMAAGIPLTDADRQPWLEALNKALAASRQAGRHPVLACSALKQAYRERLLEGLPGIIIVYLQGNYEVIWERMAARPEHYMQPAMLHSQFEALEEPQGALVADVRQPPEEIVEAILRVSAACPAPPA